jgi:hypothetical protein
MPRLDELPEAIRSLARRNAVRLTHERFRADAHSLVKALQQALDEAEALRHARAEAIRRAHTEAERKREEEASNERAKAQREAEEQARREKEQARLTAVAGLSAEQIDKAEELANWDFIKASESAQEFRDHIARFPHGVTERMARATLESLLWARLSPRHDLHALRSFLDEFPDGRYAADAKTRLADWERQAPRRSQEMAGCASASAVGKAAELKAFLSNWPQRLRGSSGTVLGLLFVFLMAAISIAVFSPLGRSPSIVVLIPVGIAALLAYWRRAALGSTEVALYWLGCVLLIAAFIQSSSFFDEFFYLRYENHAFELIMASKLGVTFSIAVCSAVVFAYWRRALLSRVEQALYWLGCSAFFLLAMGSLFLAAQPEVKGTFGNGYLAGLLIVVAAAAILAYWDGAVPGRYERFIYILSIGTFGFIGAILFLI